QLARFVAFGPPLSELISAWPFLLCQNPIVAVSPLFSGDGVGGGGGTVGGGRTIVTVAVAVAVAGIPHAVPVAVATFVSVRTFGGGGGGTVGGTVGVRTAHSSNPAFACAPAVAPIFEYRYTNLPADPANAASGTSRIMSPDPLPVFSRASSRIVRSTPPASRSYTGLRPANVCTPDAASADVAVIAGAVPRKMRMSSTESFEDDPFWLMSSRNSR